ncbi:CHASE2 domain-containing protein [Brevundimonas sp.]|uniref:CHASE2 domain-containing protein n=1 Tax=Brevundimonas sp. TaxID=1871086 RepID=UPI00289677C3|nr:CHASE2 domain-containing protein [Brevundimonas sp.]
MTPLGTRVLMEWVITAVVSVLLVLWLSLAQVIQRGDNLFYDTVSQLTAAQPHPDIVIVTIDDRSLQAIGAWPWPRSQHAALIDHLTAAQTKAVAYDVLFIEPTEDDAVLAQAMAKAGNVYLPAAIDTPGMNGKLSSVSLPTPVLQAAAAGVGHGLLTPDSDGTIRSLPLWVSADGQVLPHLALLLTRNGSEVSVFAEAPPDVHADKNGALEALQPRLIRYPRGIAPYPSVSFVDVLRGEVPDDFLRDKRVLVGATAQGMGDRYATPSTHDGALLPGVNIVASLAQNILDNRPIIRAEGWLAALLSLIPLAVMLTGFLTLRPIANTVLGFGLIALTLMASAAGLKLGIWWPPLAACAGVIFVWPLWSWRRLAATYTYMRSALNDLRNDDAARPLSALSPVHDWKSGDEISRQVLSFSSALKQFRDFNRYITQSVHSLPDAALMTDLDGVVLIANRRAHHLFPARTLEGAHLETLFHSIGLREWRLLIDADNSERDEIQLEDGRSIQIAIAALTDTLQRSTGLIVRLADVSHLRAAERERQRTLQLLGHDMRAPQVSILTLLDNPNRPENLEDHIRRNARQTLNLAEGYVQLSRAENQMLTFDVVNLADLVTEAADTLWPQSAAKGVELIVPDDGEEYLVEADTALMRRVIINLLDNAIRHTPAGRLIACTLSRLDNRILLMICDQGSGLDDDMKARLFQPFAGGNVAGSGLGLAFVHTVIQRHGGQITIEPPHGIIPPYSGACFYITLPAFDGE